MSFNAAAAGRDAAAAMLHDLPGQQANGDSATSAPSADAINGSHATSPPAAAAAQQQQLQQAGDASEPHGESDAVSSLNKPRQPGSPGG